MLKLKRHCVFCGFHKSIISQKQTFFYSLWFVEEIILTASPILSQVFLSHSACHFSSRSSGASLTQFLSSVMNSVCSSSGAAQRSGVWGRFVPDSAVCRLLALIPRRAGSFSSGCHITWAGKPPEECFSQKSQIQYGAALSAVCGFNLRLLLVGQITPSSRRRRLLIKCCVYWAWG